MADRDSVMLLTALTAPDSRKARKLYLKACGLEPADDHAIYQLLEDAVIDAVIAGDPVVELRLGVAEQVLLLAKNGVRRPRGGQPRDPHRDLRMRSWVSLGRQIKAGLIAKGSPATEAHLEAAERVAADAKERGLTLSPEYLARMMHSKLPARADNERRSAVSANASDKCSAPLRQAPDNSSADASGEKANTDSRTTRREDSSDSEGRASRA